MLKASDHERIDQVPPFPGAVADVFFEYKYRTTSTKNFTMYLDLNVSLKRNIPCWREV